MIESKFQRLYPCFRGRVTRLDHCGNCMPCGHMRKERWRSLSLTASLYSPSLISHKSISRAVSAGAYLVARPRKQGYSRCCRVHKLTYALSHIYFLLMVAIFDFQRVGPYSHLSLRVARPQKHGYSR